MQTKRSFISAAICGSSKRLALHHVAPVAGGVADRDEDRPVLARGRAPSASSPHGYQSTGLSACWSRYGEVSVARRFGIAATVAFHVPSSRNASPRLGAPDAAGPYSHAVKAGGLIFLLRPDAARSRTPAQLVEGDIGAQTRRCLDNLAIVAAAAGASLDDAVRCGDLRDRHRDVQGRQRGLRLATSATPPARTTIGVAVAAARRRGRDRRDPRRPGLTTVTAADDRRGARRRSRRSRAARRCCRRARSPSAPAARSLLKAENLQRTGSFKVRGASAKLAALGEEGCAHGVVAASAGNHAQALAAAARGARRARARCSCRPTRRSPRSRPRAAQGAIVHIGGASLDECLDAAHERGRATAGWRSCTRSTTRTIVAGQGSLGLELLEDVPDLARVVVPVGGGGLASGVAIAVKSARPEVEVIGVQVAACAPYPASLRARARRSRPTPALTIADGIAVKRPGDLTLALLRRVARRDGGRRRGGRRRGDGRSCSSAASSSSRARARSASPRCWAARSRRPSTARRSRCCRGGNVDAGLLLSIARRHETLAGRRLVVLTPRARPPRRARRRCSPASPRPARNIVDVSHVREGFDLHVRETAVELVLETRGREHADRVLRDDARRRLSRHSRSR